MTAQRTPASPGRRPPGTGDHLPVPGWHIWKSDTGRPHATRTGRHAEYDGTGVPMTVDADTEGELLALLDGYREM